MLCTVQTVAVTLKLYFTGEASLYIGSTTSHVVHLLCWSHVALQGRLHGRNIRVKHFVLHLLLENSGGTGLLTA